MGEPFRAEIDLLSVALYPDERTTLTARLASPEIYPLADFRYNPALTGARLNVRTRPNGRHVIEVVSVRPLNEPFVYLLVELESNATRMVRGYTALLDPQGYRLSRATVRTEFLPGSIPATVPAAIPAAVRAPAVDNRRAAARHQWDQASLSAANAKTLAGMLERVAALELAVEQLQGKLAMLNSIEPVPKPGAEAPPAPKPVETKAAPVAAPAPPAAEPAKPAAAATAQPAAAAVAASAPRVQGQGSILNDALLVLVIGLLIMLGWLAWVMWGPPSKERAPKGKA